MALGSGPRQAGHDVRLATHAEFEGFVRAAVMQARARALGQRTRSEDGLARAAEAFERYVRAAA